VPSRPSGAPEKGWTRELVCTFCEGQISPTLEYTPRPYSEHRDHTGYECDDCTATWSQAGEVVTEGVARCPECAHPFTHAPNCWCGCEPAGPPEFTEHEVACYCGGLGKDADCNRQPDPPENAERQHAVDCHINGCTTDCPPYVEPTPEKGSSSANGDVHE
jgi:hypothetical protein